MHIVFHRSPVHIYVQCTMYNQLETFACMRASACMDRALFGASTISAFDAQPISVFIELLRTKRIYRIIIIFIY